MTWESLLAFNAALLLAILSPGPSLLLLTRQSLTHGRAAGIATALGLGCTATLWTLAALLGLQTIFILFPWAYAVMKTAGALYLIWLAIGMWRHARDPLQADAPKTAPGRAFLQGVLVNLANPKSVFFAAAVLVVIFPAELSAQDKALIYFNHLAVEVVVQPILAILLSTAALKQRYIGIKSIIDRVAGAVLGALGLRLLLEKTP